VSRPLPRVTRRLCRDLAIRAALVCLVVSRATSWCNPCAESSTPAQSRVPQLRAPPCAAARHRPCACVRPHPSNRDPAISTRFDLSQPQPPDRSHPIGSHGLDRSKRQVKPRRTGQPSPTPPPFCKRNPDLSLFHAYALPQFKSN
jgi:hypothetical protein